MQEKAQLKLRITIARSTALMFALVTVFNAWLTMRASDWTLPFSSVISSYTIAVCKGTVDLENAPRAYIYIAIAITAIIVLFLGFAYFKSKNNAKWLRGVLLFAAVDTAAIIFILVSSGTVISYIIEIPMHLLLMYYLYKGISAADKLDRLETIGDVEEYRGEEYDKECDKVFEIGAGHDGNTVQSALYNGEIVLAVNGAVLDRADFEPKYDYELSAQAGGHTYTMYYSDDEQIITLYADGEQFYSKSVK